MNAFAAAAIVALVAVMTYAFRASVIVALAGREIPVPVARALRQVGPAVLAALAINLAAGGEGEVGVSFAEGAALMVAGIAAWRWKNIIVSLVLAMAVLLTLSAVT